MIVGRDLNRNGVKRISKEKIFGGLPFPQSQPQDYNLGFLDYWVVLINVIIKKEARFLYRAKYGYMPVDIAIHRDSFDIVMLQQRGKTVPMGHIDCIEIEEYCHIGNFLRYFKSLGYIAIPSDPVSNMFDNRFKLVHRSMVDEELVNSLKGWDFCVYYHHSSGYGLDCCVYFGHLLDLPVSCLIEKKLAFFGDVDLEEIKKLAGSLSMSSEELLNRRFYHSPIAQAREWFLN